MRRQISLKRDKNAEKPSRICSTDTGKKEGKPVLDVKAYFVSWYYICAVITD